jgi:hypothetical protein
VPAGDRERSGEHQVRKGSNHGEARPAIHPLGKLGLDAKVLHWTSFDLRSLSLSRRK